MNDYLTWKNDKKKGKWINEYKFLFTIAGIFHKIPFYFWILLFRKNKEKLGIFAFFEKISEEAGIIW